jgi:Asp-tRNA(Asn)/Glu-tRNA(Gln) amidotransferase A subunit family amidase
MIGQSTRPVPHYLSRSLALIDPDSGAWITITEERAVQAARTAPSGRLTGLTFAVKDVFDTAGVRTTYGSPLFSDHVPVVTASVIDKLEHRGAVWVGKTNLNEFAYGVSGYNPTFGLIKSPIDVTMSVGGSSGGSAAAVAAGAVDFALGTDTSGSVRVPAACCGVVGFKAAWAALPMDGVYPLAPSSDAIGVLTRDIATLQRVLNLTDLPPTGEWQLTPSDELQLPPLPAAHWVLFRRQSYALHRARAKLHPTAYGRDLHLKLSTVDRLPVSVAAEVMADWTRTYSGLVGPDHILSSPVFDGPYPTVDQMLAEHETDSLITSDRLVARTAIANALGWPAVAVPTVEGSIHLTARPGREAHLLAAAADVGGFR